MGKTHSLYVGGGLQLLFGIKGKRWDDANGKLLYNEHWVRPLSSDRLLLLLLHKYMFHIYICNLHFNNTGYEGTYLIHFFVKSNGSGPNFFGSTRDIGPS